MWKTQNRIKSTEYIYKIYENVHWMNWQREWRWGEKMRHAEPNDDKLTHYLQNGYVCAHIEPHTHDLNPLSLSRSPCETHLKNKTQRRRDSGAAGWLSVFAHYSQHFFLFTELPDELVVCSFPPPPSPRLNWCEMGEKRKMAMVTVCCV